MGFMTAETSAVGNASLGRPWAPSHEQIRLAQCVLFTAAAMVFGLALLLLLRRWFDAFHKPLGSFGLVLLGLALCGSAATARLLWYIARRCQGRVARRSDWLFDMLLTAGVLGLAAAMSLPESPLIPMVVLWFAALGGETTNWLLRLRGNRAETVSELPGDDGSTEDAAAGAAGGPVHRQGEVLDDVGHWPADDESAETLPEGVSQRITRAREESGGEIVYGIVRCDFAPGQRQQNVHLAFCPPMRRRPQLSMDQVDGPTARLRPSTVESFGAGVEVKLKTASSEPSSVQIQFYACETEPDGSAA
jgi:hypothetical protein